MNMSNLLSKTRKALKNLKPIKRIFRNHKSGIQTGKLNSTKCQAIQMTKQLLSMKEEKKKKKFSNPSRANNSRKSEFKPEIPLNSSLDRPDNKTKSKAFKGLGKESSNVRLKLILIFIYFHSARVRELSRRISGAPLE